MTPRRGAIAQRCPAPHGYIEMRPIWEIPGADG